MRKPQTIALVYGHSNSLAPTLMERRMGRYLRASAPPLDGGTGFTGGQANQQAPGSGQQGGGTQTGTDNGGGQSGTQGGDRGVNNNAGQGFDPGSFWQEPAPSGSGDPASRGSESSGSGGSGSGTQDDNAAFGQRLGQQLDALNFGSPLATPEIAGQIAEGNFEGFNNALVGQQRQVARETMQMTVQVLERFGSQLFAEMDRRMSGTLNQTENTRELHAAIPLARNPAMAPVVNSIFAQALKLNQNDRGKAIAMTKDMLKGLHGTMSEHGTDLGIPPANPSGGSDRGLNINWLDELTGR